MGDSAPLGFKDIGNDFRAGDFQEGIKDITSTTMANMLLNRNQEDFGAAPTTVTPSAITPPPPAPVNFPGGIAPLTMPEIGPTIGAKGNMVVGSAPGPGESMPGGVPFDLLLAALQRRGF